MDAGHPEAFAILGDELEAFGIQVESDDFAAILHSLGDVGGLTARRGTEVGDPLGRRRVHCLHGQECAWILHVEVAFLKAGQRPERRMVGQFEHQVFRQPICLYDFPRHAFGPPDLLKFGRADPQRVHACEGFGRVIVPIHQLAGLFASPPRLPSSKEPVRVRIAQRRVLRFEFCKQLFRRGPFADIAAQDGIDEPRLRFVAQMPSQRNRLVDGRMIRHTLQPEELVEPKPQQNLGAPPFGCGLGSFGQSANPCPLPTDDAIAQLLQQTAVRRGELVLGEFSREQVLSEIGVPLRACRIRTAISLGFTGADWCREGEKSCVKVER